MMIIRRREGERIYIGDNITIEITQIGRSRVKIGIEAPKNIAIATQEAVTVAGENRAAAGTVDNAALQALAAMLLQSGPK